MRVRHGCLVGTLLPLLLTAAPAAAEPIEPIGPQLRLTQVGTDGDATVDAGQPDIAYNSVRDEYLVVWTNSAPGDSEIWGRRLRSDGSPIGDPFQISGLTGSTGPGFDAYFPAVAYDPERDRYGVAYVRTFVGSSEVFVQRLSGTGVPIHPNGDPGGPPTQASTTPGGVAHQPDIVYRADASGNDVPGDRWIVAYLDTNDDEINMSAVGAVTGVAVIEHEVSDMPSAGTASFPSLVTVPGTDDLLVAWEGVVGSDDEIWVNRVAGHLPALDGGQSQITVTHDAYRPKIAADTHTNRFAVAYLARESAEEGTEIHVQRIEAGLTEIGIDDQQVSSAGPVASGSTYATASPGIAYHPALRRYLVTWIGKDDGRPGYGDDEYELTGSVLDPDGVEAEPQDFPISRMDTSGGSDVGFGGTPVIAAGGARWLTVWDGDGLRPPLVDEEFELFGREVGMASGAAGAPAPGRRTGARLVRRFRVRATHTRVKRLAVVGAMPGTRVVLRCRGRGCPRRRSVTGSGTINLKRYVRRARLRPGAVLVVRILEPGATGRVERFRIRDDRAPARILR
jgi:hypothetical protein